MRLAQSAYNAGDYNAAIERYQIFINDYPDHQRNKDALEGMQLCYFQLGDSEQATEALNKVIEQSPNGQLAADARFRLAVNYFENENYDSAINIFKEILTLYPNSSYAMDSQFSLAKALIAQEDYHSANQELKRFMQYFPKSTQIVEAQYLIGIGYFNLESYLSAITYFQKVIELKTSSEFYISSLQNIAMCYDRLDDKPKALQYLTECLENNPAGETAQKVSLERARLLSETHQIDKAIKKFKELLKTSDKNILVEAAYRLGVSYVKQNKMKDAEKTFAYAIKKGNKGDYYQLSSIAQLASLYENSGDQQKAIAAYKLITDSTDEAQWINAAEERINALSLGNKN